MPSRTNSRCPQSCYSLLPNSDDAHSKCECKLFVAYQQIGVSPVTFTSDSVTEKIWARDYWNRPRVRGAGERDRDCCLVARKSAGGRHDCHGRPPQMTKKAQRARMTFAPFDRPFGGKNYLRACVSQRRVERPQPLADQCEAAYVCARVHWRGSGLS
jgi:hypothetical protein